MNGRTTMLEAALHLAGSGRSVFPLGEGSKFPKISRKAGGHGHKDATDDPVQVRTWWTWWPRANIGIATGPVSNLLVVDIDAGPGKVGEQSLHTLQTVNGLLPDTLRVATPTGGYHLYFAWPAGETTLTIGANVLGPNIDFRGQGGYIVAPPSRRTEGIYRYINSDTPIADPPAWLVAKLRKPVRPPAPVVFITTPDPSGSAYSDKVLENAAKDIVNAPPGGRNWAINAAAYSCGRLIGARILDRHQVDPVLLNAALQLGETRHRAETIIASGIDAGQANPRTTHRFESVNR